MTEPQVQQRPDQPVRSGRTMTTDPVRLLSHQEWCEFQRDSGVPEHKLPTYDEYAEQMRTELTTGCWAPRYWQSDTPDIADTR